MLTVASCGIAVLMVVNLVIFLRVASRYQYKTVARKREAPVHRRPQWLQPQVVDGIVIPVRGPRTLPLWYRDQVLQLFIYSSRIKARAVLRCGFPVANGRILVLPQARRTYKLSWLFLTCDRPRGEALPHLRCARRGGSACGHRSAT